MMQSTLFYKKPANISDKKFSWFFCKNISIKIYL